MNASRKAFSSLKAHTLLVAALWLAGVPEVVACWWLGQLFVFPLLVRLRVTPNHLHYHVEHHLAASVPSYRLRDFHRLLVQHRYYDGTTCAAPRVQGERGRNIFDNMA